MAIAVAVVLALGPVADLAPARGVGVRAVRTFGPGDLGGRGEWPVALSLDGRRLVTYGASKRLRIWDVAAGTVLAERDDETGRNDRPDPSEFVAPYAFLGTGDRVLAGVSRRDARTGTLTYATEILSVPDLKPLATFPARPVLALSPDGATGLCARYEPAGKKPTEYEVWDWKANKVLFKLDVGEGTRVEHPSFRHDGKTLAASVRPPVNRPEPTAGRPAPPAEATPAYVQLWDVPTGKPLARFGHRDEGGVFAARGVAVAPDGETVAVCDPAGGRLAYEVWFWNTDTRRAFRTPTPPGPLAESYALAGMYYWPDGRHLVLAGSFGVRVWNTRDDTLFPAAGAPLAPVLRLVVAPGGRHVATVGEGGTVTVWALHVPPAAKP